MFSRKRKQLLSSSLAFGLTALMASNFSAAAVKTQKFALNAHDAASNVVSNCHLVGYVYYDDAKKPVAGYTRLLAIHGGGWTTGSPWASTSQQVKNFTSAGFMVIAPQYRMLDVNAAEGVLNTTQGTDLTGLNGGGCGRVHRDDQKRDIKEAYDQVISWTNLPAGIKSSVDWNKKVVLLGESAGAHLAADFALTNSGASSLGGVVMVNGPSDMLEYWKNATGSKTNYSQSNRTMTIDNNMVTITQGTHYKAYTKASPTDPGILNSYYWNSDTQATALFATALEGSSFVQTNRFDLRISDNRQLLKPVPPFYVVQTSTDDILAPEQGLTMCKGIGSPTNIPFGDPGYDATYDTTYVLAHCGGVELNSYIDVPTGFTVSVSHLPLAAPAANVIAKGLYKRLTTWMTARTQ